MCNDEGTEVMERAAAAAAGQRRWGARAGRGHAPEAVDGNELGARLQGDAHEALAALEHEHLAGGLGAVDLSYAAARASGVG